MTAYQMALALWREGYSREPKASDAQFLALVKQCALALRGRSNGAWVLK